MWSKVISIVAVFAVLLGIVMSHPHPQSQGFPCHPPHNGTRPRGPPPSGPPPSGMPPHGRGGPGGPCGPPSLTTAAPTTS